MTMLPEARAERRVLSDAVGVIIVSKCGHVRRKEFKFMLKR
jgi:hypothetical protein